MAVKIVCPLCIDGDGNPGEVFTDWKLYARHILSDHKEDEERGTWATNALTEAGEPAEAPQARKGKGKLH